MAGADANGSARPAGAEAPPEEMRALGEAMLARSEAVIAETVARTITSGEVVEDSVQQSFERICAKSTVAVSRWIGGEGIEVTADAARDSSKIFAEMAHRRAASLHEVTRRSLIWRNAMADELRAQAARLGVGAAALTHALNLLQLSAEFSLVRMCECFERERRRTDEELARREQELAFMATHDPLTGLPNRTLIHDRVEHITARSQRAQSPVAALFIDLDNFKSINDTLGHGVGDELLKAVAERLKAVVRNADSIGRLGGDEFVVIVEELTLGVAPELVAERLLTALREPFVLGEDSSTRLTVSASIGIAVSDGSPGSDLLRDADIAMYRAKREGRNGYATYEEDMHHVVQDRLELEMDLRAALENDEFVLVYQPTFDLSTMRPTGVEALVRWCHPTRGTIQPDAFIPLLEETGLIVEVGAWVLREACSQAAVWRRTGLPLAIAVNVSARQLDSDRLIADVEEALADSGLDAGALTLEITETALMRNAAETVARLSAVKQLGVRVAIDDFGTGYSSLAQLQQFPVDALKIDRSFISGLHESKEGGTLIRTLVQLGKALSIETLAEGIEEPGELTLLRAEDCDSGQGFLFARPLEPADAEEFFARWATGPAAAAPGGTVA